MNTLKDYYEILEVHPKASQEIIKKAYQTLAKKYHPDTTDLDKNIATKKMAELNEAFSILSNEKSRNLYDNGLNSNVSEDKQAHGKDDIDHILLSPAGKYICELCDKTMKSINKNIIPRSGCENQNERECFEIASYFDNKLNEPLSVIKKLYGDKENIFNIIGFVYWRIACSYTWTKNIKMSEKYIDLSISYISKKASFYDDFVKSVTIIKNNTKAFSEYELKKKKNRKISLLIWGAIILFIVISAISSPSATNKKVNNAAHQTQVQETPIAKNNVSSKYDNSQKILNNN